MIAVFSTKERELQDSIWLLLCFVTQSALTRCLRTLLIAKDQVKKCSSDLWGEAPYIDVGVLELDLV